MNKIKTTLLMVLLLTFGVYAGYNTPGTTTGQFLAVGLSARTAGLGESAIANLSDISAIFYNPGAMVNIARWDILFTHTRLPAEISLASISIGHHLSRNQVIGFSVTSLYTDEMIVRTPLQPEGTGETFYSTNYTATVGLSSYLTDRFSFGVNAKYIHLGYWSTRFSASSWGVDVGALFRSGLRNFNIGVAINNLGPAVKLIKESYNIPTSFNAGVSANILDLENQALSVMASWNKPMSGEEKAHLGLEYNFAKLIYFRSGYKFNHDSESWSFGIGLTKKIGGINFKADYSYSDFSYLKYIQRFSVGFTF